MNENRFSETLQTSLQVLRAIEIIADSRFKKDSNDRIEKNAAYRKWLDCDLDQDVFDALTPDAEEGEEIFWGIWSFAIFKQGKWRKL